MAINTFSFDGASSETYKVFISEGASFNAPERAVEMLSVPGRNGAFCLDYGRFENVEVVYHAWVSGNNKADFVTNITNLRNWLCSKVGYCRLTDTYNPNEYRMAVYKSGLEVEDTTIMSGEFDIVFDCKPQRFLTSGESAVTVANNGTVTNPTLFDSHPLIEFNGYGIINIGDYSISIVNVPIGEINIAKSKDVKNQLTVSQTFPYGALKNNDTIYAKERNYDAYFALEASSGYVFAERDHYIETFYIEPISLSDDFNYGSAHTYSGTATLTDYMYAISTPETLISFTITYDYSIAYNGTDTITFTLSNYALSGAGASHIAGTRYFGIVMSDIWANSTKQVGDPALIDCDLGECYTIKNGDVISLNQHIDLGSDLPKLASGATTISYDNTITDLEITPRWWKV